MQSSFLLVQQRSRSSWTFLGKFQQFPLQLRAQRKSFRAQIGVQPTSLMNKKGFLHKADPTPAAVESAAICLCPGRGGTQARVALPGGSSSSSFASKALPRTGEMLLLAAVGSPASGLRLWLRSAGRCRAYLALEKHVGAPAPSALSRTLQFRPPRFGWLGATGSLSRIGESKQVLPRGVFRFSRPGWPAERGG